MGPELVMQFEHLDTRLEQMVARVQKMPHDQQQTPVGKSFSPMQAIEHMAVTEGIYVDLKNKTKAEALKGRKGKPNFLFGIVLQKLGHRTKQTPAPKPFVPKEQRSIEESAAKWRAYRKELVEYLNKFDDDAAAIKHPIFGYISPYDIFLLQEKHQDYHDLRLE